MTREEFDRLVRDVETGVGRDPTALQRRTLWLALAGYVGLLGWFAGMILIAGAFFTSVFWADQTGKIVCGVVGTLVLLGGGSLALRALLIRAPLPKGRAVTRHEAPELFATLDALQSQLQSASFHTVLITSECNAGVVQVPRLGLLGWSRNFLLLGLPLLDGLSRDEMRAVLAHEFAHLSRAHGRFSHWLYRLRRSWEQVFPDLSRPRHRGELSLRPLTLKYVNWFWPRFNAHAFVLSRANEYEADAQAARICGREQIASALIRLQILSRVLEKKFWPELWQRANDRAEPPDDMLQQLRESLRHGASLPERAEWFDEAFRVTTSNADTHPCLSERLRALACATLPPRETFLDPATPSAAESWLGPVLATVRQDLQQQWRTDVAADWRSRHARAGALGHRLTAFEQAAPTTLAGADALWDKAVVLFDLHSDKAAEPLLRQILTLRSDHTLANFHLGRILLEAGQAEGEELIERAMASDPSSVGNGCALLHAYYRRTGQADKLRALATREDRHEKELEASLAERSAVRASDVLIPHGLVSEELVALRQVLAGERELRQAELAQKSLRYFPEQKLFVLCVHRAHAWYLWPNRDRERALARRLSQTVRLPGRVLVFPPSGSFRALARKLRQVPDAQIWVAAH